MNKILTFLVAAVLVGVFVPSSQASETVSRDYVGALGASVAGEGAAFIFCYAPGVCNFDDDAVNPGDEIPFAVGGADLIASGFYANAVVSGQDDLFGTDLAMAPCFYHPDGDLTCAVDGDDGVSDYPGAEACGPQSLLGAPFVSNFVSVFVYAVLVQEDLTTCGAINGHLTADLF